MADIFISHITEESEIAKNLTSLLNQIFTSEVEIFVSSDQKSINAGVEWFESIKESLITFKIQVLLISQISKTRQWILFEAGAGWARSKFNRDSGVIVIPACYGGVTKNKLEPPLNFLQSINLTDYDDIRYMLKSIFKTLKPKLNGKDPEIEAILSKYEKEIKQFNEFIIDCSKDYMLKKHITEFKKAISQIQQEFDNSPFTENLKLKNHEYYLKKGGCNILQDLYEYGNFTLHMDPFACGKFKDIINQIELSGINIMLGSDLVDLQAGRRIYKQFVINIEQASWKKSLIDNGSD